MTVVAVVAALLAAVVVYAGLRWVQTPLPEVPVRPEPAPRSGAPADPGGPADLLAGSYRGDVVADSQGGSRSGITLTVRKIDGRTVRVSSDDPGLGVVDVRLTRVDGSVINADGDTALILDLTKTPPILDYNAHGTVAYRGEKRP